MGDALLFVALSLGTYRIWRFLARDTLTEPFWSRIPGKLGEGWRCSWCLGTWLSLYLPSLVHHHVVTLEPHWLVWGVAVAAVVGFLGQIDDRLSE